MAKNDAPPPPKHRPQQAATATVEGGDLMQRWKEANQRVEESYLAFQLAKQEAATLFNELLGGMPAGGPSPASSEPATAPKSAPPPKHRPAAPAAKEKEGEKKKDGEKKKVSPDERNYDNEISLAQAVWNVLDRKEHAEGLKVSEIVDVIEKEKIWQSSADDISNMVQGTVYNLKEKGKLVRGESKKYYIPEGATPPETRKKAEAAA